MMDFQKTGLRKIAAKIRPRWTYANFWYDVRYNKWTVPYHKRKLMKGLTFCTWDIVDSMVELTFRQFELFWGDNGSRFTDAGYLAKVKKDQRNWYDAIIIQQKIFRYITDIRKFNKKLLDDTQSEQWRFTRHYFVPCDDEYKGEKCSMMKTDYLEGYFQVTFSFDKKDRLAIKKVQPSRKNRFNLFMIEEKLEEIDNKYLHMIIDARRYMWS